MLAWMTVAMAVPAVWREVEDCPGVWATGEGWQVRLNEFPDEVAYTLSVRGVAVLEFDDWPERWLR